MHQQELLARYWWAVQSPQVPYLRNDRPNHLALPHYYGSHRTGAYQIWKVPTEVGESLQVTRRGGYNPIESLDGRFLYFAKGRPETGLWRMPVEGGEETAVLPDLPNAGANAPWDVAANGIYFVEFEAGPSLGNKWVLQLLRFDTGEVSTVMELPTSAGPALEISPDGQSFLYPQADMIGTDLMLVENFQ